MSLVLLGILNSQAAAAGGAGDFALLEEITLTSESSQIEFTGIDSYSDYRHLTIRASNYLGTAAFAGLHNIDLRMNGDTNSSRYSYVTWYQSGTSFSATGSANNNSIERIYTSSGVGSEAGDLPYFEILLPDFNSTNKAKTFQIKYQLGAFSTSIRSGFVTGTFDQTSATTSLTLSESSKDWGIGSTFALYGWK